MARRSRRSAFVTTLISIVLVGGLRACSSGQSRRLRGSAQVGFVVSPPVAVNAANHPGPGMVSHGDAAIAGRERAGIAAHGALWAFAAVALSISTKRMIRGRTASRAKKIDTTPDRGPGSVDADQRDIPSLGRFNHYWFHNIKKTAQMKQMGRVKIDTITYQRPKKRMSYNKSPEAEDSVAVYTFEDCLASNSPKLRSEDVKKVGTCEMDAKSNQIFSPAKLPTFDPPSDVAPWRLEQDLQEKPRPGRDEAYLENVIRSLTLADMAKTTSAAGSLSLDKDIICDDGSLGLILRWVSGDLTPFMQGKVKPGTPVDLFMVTRLLSLIHI